MDGAIRQCLNSQSRITVADAPDWEVMIEHM